MTRVKKKHFFECYDIAYNNKNVMRYENGWTLQEIKQWKEYIMEWYEKEVKAFKKTII